ncbi:MAG: rhodanese-like domain-containing protein [Myxococcota bacterium]
MGAFKKISSLELKAKMDDGWAPFVLDVRGAQEAEVCRLAFADLLHPHHDVASIVDQLPQDRDIVVHCKMGGRSAMACETLSRLGFDNCTNLEGGIMGWIRDVDPSLQRY